MLRLTITIGDEDGNLTALSMGLFTNKWRRFRKAMAESRKYCIAAAIDRHIFVFGGMRKVDCSEK